MAFAAWLRMDELRVPKRRVAAEVHLPGGAPRKVVLFLAEAAGHHAGPESPGDVFNGADEFVPAFDEAARAMSFLQRGALSVVRFSRDLDTGDGEALTLPTEHEVEVHLGDGAVLTGLVSYLRPPESARLVDFLNDPSPFFRLLEADAVALVNKRHVARVTLVSR
jgi:hypothetical protein